MSALRALILISSLELLARRRRRRRRRMRVHGVMTTPDRFYSIPKYCGVLASSRAPLYWSIMARKTILIKEEAACKVVIVNNLEFSPCFFTAA
jgi:hypothetical protein